jgi:hypothetical protein
MYGYIVINEIDGSLFSLYKDIGNSRKVNNTLGVLASDP